MSDNKIKSSNGGKKIVKPTKKEVKQEIGYLIETPKNEITKADNAIEINASLIPDALMPKNWVMINDILVKLNDDILINEDRMVVKNNGIKAQDGPIGTPSMETVTVKSSVKFGHVVHPGKNTNFKAGELVSIDGRGIKIIDFDKNYAVVPHFMIYGKLGESKSVEHRKTTTNRKNIFRWILQGWHKWLGIRNVHKQQ